MLLVEPPASHMLGWVGVWQLPRVNPPYRLMSNQICHDILPRFYRMWVSKSCLQVAVAKERQATNQVGYLQSGKAQAVDKKSLGGWAYTVLCLEKTCALLLRKHCLALPLSQWAKGSCRSAALFGVLPVQNSGRMAAPGLPVLISSREQASWVWIVPCTSCFRPGHEVIST